MLDSSQKMQLQSYARLRSEDATLVVCPTPVALPDFGQCHDSGRISWLWSCITTPVDGWARWLQHLAARTLSGKQTGRDAWLDQCSKPQYLMASHAQVVSPCATRWTTLSPTWSKRNPNIQKDSVPLQLEWINVFECLVRRAKALCHVTMSLRTDHTWEKFLAQQIEQGPDPGRWRLRMLYEISAWRPQS
jgi:hypothetical protein